MQTAIQHDEQRVSLTQQPAGSQSSESVATADGDIELFNSTVVA